MREGCRPNRTEPDLRASTFARAVLAATDMVQAATEVVATAYAAGASKVKWSKSATGQVIKHVIPRTYGEAASHPECALIWEAMMREMHSHESPAETECTPCSPGITTGVGFPFITAVAKRGKVVVRAQCVPAKRVDLPSLAQRQRVVHTRSHRQDANVL